VHDEREIEARYQHSLALERAAKREKIEKFLPELLTKIVHDAKKGRETKSTESEIASLISSARREDVMPKGIFERLAPLLRRAFFVMRSVLVDELVGPVLLKTAGNARERLVLGILEHPFFNDIEKLDRRAEIISWNLVREGRCTKATRELQILSIPRCVREEVGKAAMTPEAAETALVAMSLPRMKDIMEWHILGKEKEKLLGRITEKIKAFAEPPSDELVARLIKAADCSFTEMSIWATLTDRFGYQRFGCIAIQKNPAFTPREEKPWSAQNPGELKGSIREMEEVFRSIRAAGKKQKDVRSGNDRNLGSRKVIPM
jgi:hypothetical protein